MIFYKCIYVRKFSSKKSIWMLHSAPGRIFFEAIHERFAAFYVRAYRISSGRTTVLNLDYQSLSRLRGKFLEIIWSPSIYHHFLSRSMSFRSLDMFENRYFVDNINFKCIARIRHHQYWNWTLVDVVRSSNSWFKRSKLVIVTILINSAEQY